MQPLSTVCDGVASAMAIANASPPLPASGLCVVVTGANGFIGGHIVIALLREGHTVHGTLRDPNSAKAAFLRELPRHVGVPDDRLRLFPADLLLPGSFDNAVTGAHVVVHAAAVVKDEYDKDPFAEVINPAVDGVRNVMAACRKAGTIRRVVYTSSIGTVLCAEKDRPPHRRRQPFTESEWGCNTKLSPTYGTYVYAKVEAEKVFYEEWKGPHVVLCPGFVFGPQLNSEITSSQQVLRLLVNREYPVCPRLFFEWVDVRDVARAHALAVTSSLTSGRFHITSGSVHDVSVYAKHINALFPGELRCPTMLTPWWALYLLSFCDKRITRYMLEQVAVETSPCDATASKRDFGFHYHYGDLDVTLRDTIASFRTHGILKSHKKAA